MVMTTTYAPSSPSPTGLKNPAFSPDARSQATSSTVLRPLLSAIVDPLERTTLDVGLVAKRIDALELAYALAIFTDVVAVAFSAILNPTAAVGVLTALRTAIDNITTSHRLTGRVATHIAIVLFLAFFSVFITTSAIKLATAPIGIGPTEQAFALAVLVGQRLTTAFIRSRIALATGLGAIAFAAVDGARLITGIDDVEIPALGAVFIA